MAQRGGQSLVHGQMPGGIYKLVSALSVVAMGVIIFIAVAPPNLRVLYVVAGYLVLLGIMWLTVERRRFKGPPTKERIATFKEQLAERQRTSAETEKEAPVIETVDNDASALEQGDTGNTEDDFERFVKSIDVK